jgi:hypothetical protein
MYGVFEMQGISCPLRDCYLQKKDCTMMFNSQYKCLANVGNFYIILIHVPRLFYSFVN